MTSTYFHVCGEDITTCTLCPKPPKPCAGCATLGTEACPLHFDEDDEA